jgi:hypothetical protein
MTDLITRLSTLDAPDRKVDAEICILFQYGGLNSEGATNVRTDPDWDGDLLFEIGNEACCNPIPKLTASVDAAIALAERVLPGWYWGITQGDDGEDAVEFQGNVWPSIQPYPAKLEQYGYHKLPAIALLIALLRAKEASNVGN